jgi:predicted PurR-regulated permease PerM
MDLGEKDIKKLLTFLLIIILFILSYFVVRPILIAAIGGLILAYVFRPVYRKINKVITNKNLATWIVVAMIILLIFIPLYFILPAIIQQVYDTFSEYQSLDMASIVRSIFPNAAPKFLSQATLTLNNFVSTLTLYFSKSMVDFILDVPFLLIDLFVLSFVFFYALRDADKLGLFMKSISPLSEANETKLVKHFKDITDTIIYGQVVIGIVQGLTAGIGFALFGVKNALLLTILAMFFSIIPFVGAWVVWVPVNIYLFATRSAPLALGFLAYNLLFVSIIDNIIRSYLISRKTAISPAIIIAGMIGGIFLFNLIGLILGPLILAYLITLLESFKNQSVYKLFSNKP